MIFKRKIYNRLLEWKRTDNGKTALLIQGARRIGKSTIAEEFARNEYESYILIDFAECSEEIRNLFNDVSDLNRIFLRLQVEFGVSLIERKSLIIFDEIQFAPKARQAIKYLVKDGRYDYLETGSLISIRKNIEGIMIPSEEVDLKMYPMDYEEFRWALGDKVSCEVAKASFLDKKPLDEKVSRKLMDNFRLYLLVGGMPQAIETYLETNDLALVDRTKRNIISLYEKDFNRIDPTGYASMLFHQIPAQLTGNANRYMTWSASNGRDYTQLEEIIVEMRESMVVNLAYHADDPNVGLSFHQSLNKFKMYIGDTGLFVTLAFWDQSFMENSIYKKMLANRLPADLGYVYENVVSQMLKCNGKELFYYTFPTESGKHNYEIDFLIPDGHKICPVEVKSSGYKTHASLDAFYRKYSHRISKEFLVYSSVLKFEEGIVYLPFYMVPFI